MKLRFNTSALAGSLVLGLALMSPAFAAQTLPGGPITPAPDREIRPAKERSPARPAAVSAGACKQGYVFRKSGPSDRVCVSPKSAARVAEEDRMGKKRVQPGGGAYGPNTCRSGFVWREAFAGDGVCVRPQIRALVAAENRGGPSLLVR